MYAAVWTAGANGQTAKEGNSQLAACYTGYKVVAVVTMNSTQLAAGCFFWCVGVRECQCTAEQAVGVHVSLCP